MTESRASSKEFLWKIERKIYLQRGISIVFYKNFKSLITNGPLCASFYSSTA